MRLVLISLFVFFGLASYASASWLISAGPILSYEKYNTAEIKENKLNAFQVGRKFDEWISKFEYSQASSQSQEGVFSVSEDTQNFIYWSDYRIKNLTSLFEPFVGFGLGIKKTTVQQKINSDSLVTEGSNNLLGATVGVSSFVANTILVSAEARIYKEPRRYSQASFFLGLGFGI